MCSDSDAKIIYEKMTIIMCNLLPLIKEINTITDYKNKIVDRYYDYLDIDINIVEIGFTMLLMNPIIYKTMLYQFKNELQADIYQKKSEKIIKKLLDTDFL